MFYSSFPLVLFSICSSSLKRVLLSLLSKSPFSDDVSFPSTSRTINSSGLNPRFFLSSLIFSAPWTVSSETTKAFTSSRVAAIGQFSSRGPKFTCKPTGAAALTKSLQNCSRRSYGWRYSLYFLFSSNASPVMPTSKLLGHRETLRLRAIGDRRARGRTCRRRKRCRIVL